MPLNPRLVFIDNENPARWALYALCVLNRAVSFGATDLIRQWVEWAGGGTFNLITPNGPLASGAVVIQDGEKAIICLGGTRSLAQLGAQIVGSCCLADPVGEGNVGAFWGEYANRLSPALDAAIGPLPGDAPALLFGHSLGAAVAQILACRYRHTSNRVVAGLVTTGQPRAGDASLQTNNPPFYTRIVNQGDPVTGIPPQGNTLTSIGSTASLGISNFNYAHGGQMWQLTATSFGPAADITVPATLSTFLDATLQGPAVEAAILQFHDIAVYAARLLQFVEPLAQRPDITAVKAINVQLDGLAGQQSVLPLPVPIPPLAQRNVLAAPNVIIDPIPAHLPLVDLRQLIQFIQFNIPRVFSNIANPILLFSENGMPALVKCTFMFTQRNQGWSESYYRTGSLADTVQKAYDLGSALMAFRGLNTGLNGVRIALVNVPRVFPVSRLAQLLPPLSTWASGTAVINGDKDSDAASTCMLMRCYDGTGNAAAKFIFMRGISDNFVVAGGVPVPQGMSIFGGAWTTLQTTLGSNGWGWVGNNATPTVQPITGLAYTAPNSGFVAITFTGPLFPVGYPLNAGVTVPIRISRLISPANLNGSIPVVLGGSLAACTTKKRVAILNWDGASGQASFNAKQFWQFMPYTAPGGLGNTGILLDRIGERKPGRPFGTPPGRAKNRVRA